MNNESECFTEISKYEKTIYENNVWKRCFRVFVYPGETRALVVYMASQMNQDVTGCVFLLIWIEFLTNHIIIRNSIEIDIAYVINILDENNTSDFDQIS